MDTLFGQPFDDDPPPLVASGSARREGMEAAAGFEPAHNGFAVRSLNHLGTPPFPLRTASYTTRSASDSLCTAPCADHVLTEAPNPSRIAVAPLR